MHSASTRVASNEADRIGLPFFMAAHAPSAQGRKRVKLRFLAAVLAAVLATPWPAQANSATADDRTPEAASAYQTKPGWIAQREMVVAAHPLAADAGYTMLLAGGSAVDAAIATQLTLGLVEPQSSGIGGGAFLMAFDGEHVSVFDGRETAPGAATPSLFLKDDGTPMAFYDRVVGGRAVGVPGVLAMMALAHRRYGRLPWAALFRPAIDLAERGFPVSPRLAHLLRVDRHLRNDPEALAYFYDAQGSPWPAGHLLKNHALAKVYEAIAADGPDAFYRGPIAADIVSKVRSHPTNPGSLQRADLAHYRARERRAVCGPYRYWRVCGAPPPSSGGIAVAQVLGMLEHVNLSALPPHVGRDGAPQPDARAIHWITEAERLAYADRARYVADDTFVPLPGGSPDALLAPVYLARRAALIGPRSMGRADAGIPLLPVLRRGSDAAPELPSTTHLVVVDRYGSAVSMTGSIENAFGARQMVDGFLLNNQLTDFSALPRDRDGPVANRVVPGKRPRSAMSPTMVFDARSRLVLAIGSPGGPMIPTYVVKVLAGVLDWGLNLQQAIDLPNFGSRNGPTELEEGRFDPDVRASLREKGHVLVERAQTSGLHGVMRVDTADGEAWFGAADPRREGVAVGD